ncbi:hypothetical protein [Nocardia suismassiliense]|uniref:hypothetical protein n=1 Tax=Nocardia suismassiliense TaxID=2077092 RepID=UPI000D1E18A4|nr:hypothetical protein [Nocardia suismassiliense]
MTQLESPSTAPDSPKPDQPVATSVFVNGYIPRRRGLVLLLGVLAGFLLTVVWSAPFVDTTIGGTVADGLLGHDAKETAITGIGAGIVFAFVSGLAGTFTACNIAVFGAVAPLAGSAGGWWNRVQAVLRPLLWMAVGMVAVSAAYGVVVGIFGTDMPQFDTAPSRPGQISPRLIQSMVVFGVIGVIMTYLGLAVLGLVRDPFTRIAARFPNAPLVVFGGLIGAFLIGRPFPLFRKLFRDAAEEGNILYAASAFVLQSLGNIIILAILLILTVLVGGRLQRWFQTDPRRVSILSATALLTVGVFTFLYWDVRLLAMRDIIPWYPVAPWV